jgi:polysaccharide deacetylase 2 family uncharacterized protein YibQ
VKLPGFLKRKKDDEDDEDDFEDFEGFDDDDDAPKTQVIEDDDDLDYSPSPSDMDDDINDPGIEDADFDLDNGGLVDIDDDPMVDDEERSLADEIDDGEPTELDDDDDIEFDDDDDVEFDDDDDDDIEFDDEDDELDGDNEGSSRPVMFIVLGAFVLISGIIGGGAFWFLSGDSSETASTNIGGASEAQDGILLPPRKGGKTGAGSLNDRVAASAEVGDAPQTPAAVKSATNQPIAAKPKTVSAMTALGAGGLNARAGVAAGPRQGLIIPSVTSVSFQAIPDQTKVIPLASAPDKALVEEIEGLPGKLPIVGPRGRKPWEVYARPPTAEGSNPKVAIIVRGLGFSRAATMAAIKKLPGDITLAFSPYARDLNDWLLRARLAGHEVFMELPMESKNFPTEDAGPLALSSTSQVATNIRRLQEVMSHMEGYVGLLSVMGSKFMDAEGQLKPVLDEINRRGLMFVDGTGSRTAAPNIAAKIGLPKAFVNVTLDNPPDRQSLDRRLKSLESILKKQPFAVAVIHAYPSSIQRLNIWLRTIEDRKMSLVPLSAIADKQFIE